MRILVINCGSTTLKYKLYETREGALRVLAAALVPMKPGEEAPIAGVLGEERISAEGSPLSAYAIRADEEAGIAQETLRLLQESPTPHL